MWPAPDRKSIHGWKAIAAYVDRSVRAVQDWEKELGLPIYRDLRGVWAYVDDIDRFLESKIIPPAGVEQGPAEVAQQKTSDSAQSNSETTQEESAATGEDQSAGKVVDEVVDAAKPDPARRVWRRSTVVLALGPALVLGLLFLGIRLMSGFNQGPGRQPSRIRLDADTLVAVDERGKDLWAYTFRQGLSVGYPSDPAELAHKYIIADMNGDGRKQVFFVYLPPGERASVGSRLVLLEDGELKGQVEPGRTLVYGPDHTAYGLYSKPYAIDAMILIPGKRPTIAVTSLHHEGAANQVLVLDGKLKIVGEYWHPGHLNYMAIGDIDQDGRTELLLGGVDNRYHCATVVALDPNNVSGTTRPVDDPKLPESKQFALHEYGDDEAHLQTISRGTERYVLFFPRSYMMFEDNRWLDHFNRVKWMAATKGDFEVAVAESMNRLSPLVVVYDVSWDLRNIFANPEKAFQDSQWDRFKKKTIDHPFSESDIKNLSSRVVIRRYTDR